MRIDRSGSYGRSFVTIMIVIAVSALLLRVVVERFIKISIAQNESMASGTIKLISAALENYAKDHALEYPSNFSVLVNSKPQYLDYDYLGQSSVRGYIYSCSRLEASGYSCSALPVKCGLTGSMGYSVTTGSLLVSERCDKIE